MSTPLNRLAAIDAQFAVSSKDLGDAIARVGTSAEDAGVSFAELLALVTVAQQTTARGGPVIGHAIQTILTRLNRTATVKALAGIGIKSGHPVATLKEYAFARESLTPTRRAKLDTLIAGRFQLNILKALLIDLHKRRSTYAAALKVINAS